MAQGHETLGHNVIPRNYTLNFKPNFKTYKYEGKAAIEVEVKSSTKEISLNAAELGIRSAHVISKGVDQAAKVRSDDKLQRITLSLREGVKGSARIVIDFEGTNNEDLYGFYRSRYTRNGKTEYILSSQFEAANARNAFPCFDEPEFKATFDVSLTVNEDMECVSNMPVASQTKAGGALKTVTFKQTPVMSTYLLYLGVGKYDCAKGRIGKTELRVMTVPGSGEMAKLPLEYAKKFIAFYEDYFGIGYPLPKLDLIAIPDFAVGAMENWGAMTFRETALLADEKTSVAGKQRVAEVIAHELAHQWFGDLVTMKWWDDLWLNESFATFMSYKAMDHVFPEWKVKIEYLKDVIATAFGADQLRSTHPISVAVNSPGEIDRLFDEISYEKGGTILNMIENYAGAEIFREGLHRYLKKNAYSNATKFDLWGAIDEEAKAKKKRIDVSAVASYWIDNPGYPIIEAKRTGARLELRQERYFLLSNLSDSSVWPIPLDYAIEGKPGSVLFDTQKGSIEVPESKWIKLNHGQAGLYRVAYDDSDVQRLGILIKLKKLSGVDSWGVEHDFFSRSRSGRIRADSYLDFVGRYCMNADHPLNSNVLGHLDWLDDRLGDKKNKRAKETLLLYSNSLVKKLGWERNPNESTFDTLMRASAIMQAGLAGDPQTLARASMMFDDFIKKGKEIDPNLRGAIYSLAAWSNGESIFELLKERFIREKIPDEKIRFLRALAMFNDKDLLLSSFEFAMSDAVRKQDSFIVPAVAAGNPAARDVMLEWTIGHWKELMEKYASGTHLLSRFISNLAVLSTEEDKRRVQEFFSRKENTRDDIKQELDKTLEQIEANIRFRKANA